MKRIDLELEIFLLKLESLIMFLTLRELTEGSIEQNKGIFEKTQSEKELICKFGLKFIKVFGEMFVKEPSVSWKEKYDKEVRLLVQHVSLNILYFYHW